MMPSLPSPLHWQMWRAPLRISAKPPWGRSFCEKPLFFFNWLQCWFTMLIYKLFYNVVLVSGVEQSDSVIYIIYIMYICIYIYIYILFQVLFLYRLLQNIEFPMLYGRFLLVICYIYSSVYMLIPTSWFILAHFPFGNHKFVFYVCGSISILYRSSFVSIFFLDSTWKPTFKSIFFFSKGTLLL